MSKISKILDGKTDYLNEMPKNKELNDIVDFNILYYAMQGCLI